MVWEFIDLFILSVSGSCESPENNIRAVKGIVDRR